MHRAQPRARLLPWNVAGKDLLHLQCHFGLDTLAWARRGATVTGIDISERGVEEPRRLLLHRLEYAWQHSMGEIITSLAAAGLRIEYLHGHPRVPWKLFPFMVETGPGSGVWRLPEPYDQRLPVPYSPKATKG